MSIAPVRQIKGFGSGTLSPINDKNERFWVKFRLENTARDVANASMEVKIRHIGSCLKADKTHGAGVAEAMGIKLSEIPNE